jgi:phage tail-like protein
MPNTDEYLGSHRFYVALDNNAPADGFTTVSPIISMTEAITFKHGQDPWVRKAPGRVQWEDITLERVYCGDDSFAQWREQIVNGSSDRRTVTIEFQNNSALTKKTYTLINCFPVRWELPGLDASGSQGAMERITLCVESVMSA